MERTDTVVIGAGHAGLAISRCLADASIDHVVLERADVAHAWRAQRWDSLRLLTPNWMTRLPGHAFRGDDPDGFMSAAQVAAHLQHYARSFGAPVREHTEVRCVSTTDDGFVVDAGNDRIASRTVVVAVGACGAPHMPALSADVPDTVVQIHPLRYRRPSDVPDGRVLVVGASATGVQLAEELALAGRQVTLAVGHHTRVPRRYRGRDIHAWMHELGLFGQSADDVDDLAKVRRWPSPQLVGSPEGRDLDLAVLQAAGVELVGRLAAIRDGDALFSGSLANLCADADLKMGRLLDRIDELVGGRESRPAPVRAPTPRTRIRLTEFAAIVWAIGFRARHPFLERDLLDDRGAIVHDGGVTRRPGLFVTGLPFLRTRVSGFLAGAEHDAPALVDQIRSMAPVATRR